MNKDQQSTALAVRSISAAQSADPCGGKVVPLSRHWRHGNGVVSCGTLRIFSENFDTQPADAVKTEIVQWVCDTLNATREAAPQSSSKALTGADAVYEAIVEHCEVHGIPLDPEVVDGLSRCIADHLAAAPQPADAHVADLEAYDTAQDIAKLMGYDTLSDALFDLRKSRDAKVLTEEPRAMGENWCVSVEQNGRTILAISYQHLAGDENADEKLVIGAAQHLLAFVGYGLPPSNLDPDACSFLAENSEHPSTKALAESREAACAIPAAEQPGAKVDWCSPRNVDHLIQQLRTLDQTMQVYGAIHVTHQGERRARVRSLSMSCERVNRQWIEAGNESVPYSVVVWTDAPEQPSKDKRDV